MAYINAVLDEAVSYGFEGGPAYSTILVDLENGLEDRDSAWLYPKHKYSAKYENLPDDARDEIINTFHVCRGMRHAFKFKDWNDYQVTNATLQVTPEYVGTTNPVQLYKTYTFGDAFQIRPVQALNVTACSVAIAGVNVPGTFDSETGMFYPTSAWVSSSSYTWTGEFYVWVRFDNDYNSFTINSWKANTANVDFEEDKQKITATNVPASWDE